MSSFGIKLQDQVGGTGTVTSVSVVSANGFAGTVATATTTPAITLTTSVTGILSGNGTAISAASTTGSGSVVLATSPTLVTPTLGVALATSINGNTITTGTGTLTLGAGSTLATSATNSITLTSTGATNVTLPTTGTLSTLAGTETLTNKRITPRVSTVTTSAAPTPNSDTTDEFTVTALAEAATFGAPTGTPTDGQRLIIRILDNGTGRALSYNAIYRAIGVTLPTTTVANKLIYLGLIYNSASTKWDVVAVCNET